MQKFTNHVKELNPNAIIMPISAKTGEGMEEWADWLKKETAAWKEEEHAWLADERKKLTEKYS